MQNILLRRLSKQHHNIYYYQLFMLFFVKMHKSGTNWAPRNAWLRAFTELKSSVFPLNGRSSFKTTMQISAHHKAWGLMLQNFCIYQNPNGRHCIQQNRIIYSWMQSPANFLKQQISRSSLIETAVLQRTNSTWKKTENLAQRTSAWGHERSAT